MRPLRQTRRSSVRWRSPRPEGDDAIDRPATREEARSISPGYPAHFHRPAPSGGARAVRWPAGGTDSPRALTGSASPHPRPPRPPIREASWIGHRRWLPCAWYLTLSASPAVKRSKGEAAVSAAANPPKIGALRAALRRPGPVWRPATPRGVAAYDRPRLTRHSMGRCSRDGCGNAEHHSCRYPPSASERGANSGRIRWACLVGTAG
jgi:hypothetical protein